MNDRDVNRYVRDAEKMDREHIVTNINRASVPVSQGWAMYKRFNVDTEYVTVITLQGKAVELTRTQANVLDVARTYIDQRISMAVIADELKVARSTVWRALVKLSSYGLIGYMTARGYKHGTIILSRGKNDGLDRLQRAAQATVRKWSEATRARFARMKASVAPMIHGRGRDTLYYYFSPVVATQQWTAEDMRDLDREMGCIS